MEVWEPATKTGVPSAPSVDCTRPAPPQMQSSKSGWACLMSRTVPVRLMVEADARPEARRTAAAMKNLGRFLFMVLPKKWRFSPGDLKEAISVPVQFHARFQRLTTQKVRRV